ncbi:IS3 family transposase [Cognataquiflexum nitidum]|uniref:IS3 family transposase n=1 Tax=Cognataquiflexum nitidum TaxID=2922272 RepID=UPI001F1411A1
MIAETITELAQRAKVDVAPTCKLLGMARSTYYRLARGYQHYRRVTDPIPHTQRRQPAALTEAEKTQALQALDDPDQADASVVQVYWSSFDAGRVSCSQSTFYRIARAHNLVGDRRPGRHGGHGPGRPKPVAAAAAAGDLWSWDITMLRGPGRQLYRLYLAIDVYSRYPVAWRIETREDTALAVEMFLDAFDRHGAPILLHADNGAAMRARDLATALDAAAVGRSYSRPRVSNDNPFSEALFKTIKYDLDHPDRFDSLDHARAWTADFLHRYATGHHHSGLGRCTPQQVFTGTAEHIHRTRQARLDHIAATHPERFRTPPQAPPLPQPTGINTCLKTG